MGTGDSNSEPFDLGHATMTMIGTPKHAEPQHRQMISDDAMRNANIYINILMCGVMSTFGTFSNVVNMVVFYRLGLKDSNSVCLFALALSDFLLSLDVMVTRAFPIWNIFYDKEGVDPMAIMYAGFSWIADSLFLCSGWIVTFLSLERCVCVILPFKVKQIFTRNRSIVAVAIMYVVTASIYIPIYATHWLGWGWEGGDGGGGDSSSSNNGSNNTNTTTAINNNMANSMTAATTTTTSLRRRLVVMFSENRPKVEYYVEILSVTVIPVPSLVLTLGSVFWMVYGLHVSSRIRRTMTASVKNPTADDNDDNGFTSQDSKLAGKTRRLMAVVLVLAIICTICSIPRTFATTIKTIYPEINEGRKERNMNIFLWQLSRFFSTLNASVNMFVYISINSYYRAQLKVLFGSSSK